MIQALYTADLSGGGPVDTTAQIEAFLGKQEKKDAAATLQDELTRRVDELKK